MDFQQGLITTIHEYGVTKDLLRELNKGLKKRPTAILIPCLYEEFERPALKDIKEVLTNKINKHTSAEDIQTLLYDVGKKHQFENLKDFFKLVYQVLLGQEQGPRLGSFIKLYGVEETIKIIDQKLQNLDNVN